MIQTADCIKFESRREIENVMIAIKDKTDKSNDLKRLYDLLEAMYISW